MTENDPAALLDGLDSRGRESLLAHRADARALLAELRSQLAEAAAFAGGVDGASASEPGTAERARELRGRATQVGQVWERLATRLATGASTLAPVVEACREQVEGALSQEGADAAAKAGLAAAQAKLQLLDDQLAALETADEEDEEDGEDEEDEEGATGAASASDAASEPPAVRTKSKAEPATRGKAKDAATAASDRGWRAWVPLLLIPALIGLWFFFGGGGGGGGSKNSGKKNAEATDSDPSAKTVASDPLDPEDMQAVAELAAALWKGGAPPSAELPARFGDASQGVYVAFRSQGLRRYQTWAFDGTVADSLAQAIARGREQEGASDEAIDTLEIDLAHTFRTLDFEDDFKALTANLHRGVRGMRITLGDKRHVTAPTQFIASNRALDKHLEVVRDEWKVSEDEFARATFETFEAEQILVTLGDPPRGVLMERGNVYVPVESIDEAAARRIVDLQAQWMLANIHEDGRMTYLYWPSSGREAPPDRNNTIRQWMATVSLGRIAAFRDDPAVWEVEERNIDYNLREFYREEGEFGLIEHQGKVKLGALALAVYAIIHHPKREKWAQKEAAMRRTILHLWNDDGSFRTFYKKTAGTREQHNFYPGEALFLWSELYERERDPELLDKFMKSFAYYREWHLDPDHRNPAFIPWHTEAYYQVWKITKNDELRDFIFEMNDWLLLMQQWDDVRYRDTKGRFYSTGAWYGPPHASADGVYMEGLVDAFKLARELGDEKRTESYRIGLVRGLRNIGQLQFVDEVDTFYMSRKEAVIGGLRTTVFDNELRCDNVQHSLMANMKLLAAFSADDYRHP